MRARRRRGVSPREDHEHVFEKECVRTRKCASSRTSGVRRATSAIGASAIVPVALRALLSPSFFDELPETFRDVRNEPSHVLGRHRAHEWQPVQNQRFSWRWLPRPARAISRRQGAQRRSRRSPTHQQLPRSRSVRSGAADDGCRRESAGLSIQSPRCARPPHAVPLGRRGSLRLSSSTPDEPKIDSRRPPRNARSPEPWLRPPSQVDLVEARGRDTLLQPVRCRCLALRPSW